MQRTAQPKRLRWRTEYMQLLAFDARPVVGVKGSKYKSVLGPLLGDTFEIQVSAKLLD